MLLPSNGLPVLPQSNGLMAKKVEYRLARLMIFVFYSKINFIKFGAFRKVERRDRDLLQHIQPNQAGKEWLYRSIFDAANDGLIITDLETGLVVEANPAACMMHGYSREEFIGLQLTA